MYNLAYLIARSGITLVEDACRVLSYISQSHMGCFYLTTCLVTKIPIAIAPVFIIAIIRPTSFLMMYIIDD